MASDQSSRGETRSPFEPEIPAGKALRLYRPGEIVDQIRLSMVEGVGPAISRRLIQFFGSIPEIFTATEKELQHVDGVGPKLARQLVKAKDECHPDRLLELCEKEAVSILVPEDLRYPKLLRTIPDPPSVLYMKGALKPEDALALAVVGTRGMSYYGKKQTERLVGGLVRAGFTIVSGMARGIDGTAHQAAINAQGRTVAVLGSGFLNIFPPEHKDLFYEIAENGAVLSEFPPYEVSRAGHFPQRNRVVSGMSLGVLVVESPARGGSLITANMALEQNREVFAVPGPIDAVYSHGCNRLIRSGAHLVESVDDILDDLGPLPFPVAKPAEAETAPILHPAESRLNEREKKVLALIDTSSKSVDSIIAASGLMPGQVLAVLSVLEAGRFIIREGGNRVRRP